MELVIINNPATIGWQANLLDLVLLVMFASAVVYAMAQWRRGVRAYVTLLVAAFFYGVVLELGGMALLNMYVQGDFTVMLNFPALAPFQGTTAMPFYVLIFYPVFLFTGFKVVEAWGITRRWQAAVTGGLFMVAFDAPYIIEGGLRHVVWWTWRSDFPMFQYWLDWPLVDLCWQATWDAMFFYLMLWALPHIDPPGRRGWSTAKSLLVFAPLCALVTIAVGPLLLAPQTAVTFLGGRQWPVVLALILGYVVVAATAMRTAHPARDRVEPVTGWIVGVYVAAMAAMVIANAVHEGALLSYITVQAAGLLAICGLTLFPWLATRRRPVTIAAADATS
ncbi:hypothetical protein [Mycobacterium sp.]|uniref:hypothetical protein n=1 Tax=Mycobacterium sp. TaxID=1785 RepID=UPI000CBF9A9D|nr:hypothetical protein [Mycobacterium sp.]PJE12244.1 MAG: hypothetical protein CK428_13320 [Mycobacterium sp.]